MSTKGKYSTPYEGLQVVPINSYIPAINHLNPDLNRFGLDNSTECTYNHVHMVISDVSLVYLTRPNLKLILGRNRRTLDYRIASLIKSGSLTMLKKGFYLNNGYLEKSQKAKELIIYVGQIMVYPSYLSTEFVLSEANFLTETVFVPTYVTTKNSRRVLGGPVRYAYRKIRQDLFFGFGSKFIEGVELRVATTAKALFDMIYFASSKRSFEDVRGYLLNSRFNWDVLTKADKAEFGAIVTRAKIKRMNTVYKFMKREGLI